jgi:LPS O-antigen subunit length determinant protein (WzzB/FepE family)
MKTLARWVARLYPAAWRARYAVELEALLEDVGPRAGDLWDIARGALFMQMTSVSFWKIVAGCAVAGALAAGIVSATLPDRYVSTAVIRIKPAPQTAASGAGVLRHLQEMQQATLSRSSLSSIIQRLGIYANERKRLPLEDIIVEMRNRDIRIHPTNVRGERAFAVEVANENPAAAQATVRAIVTSLTEQNVQVSQRQGSTVTNMEVLEPASLPSRPVSPNRVKAMINGLLTGLLVGLLCGAIFSIVRRKERWSIKRIGGFAAAGMALGLTVAFLIPDEFISTAVLRTADASALQSTIAQALSDDSLAAIIRKDNLFSRELNRGNMNDAARKMRDSIRVQKVQAGLFADAFMISFRYPDRFQAQQATRDLVARFTGAPQSTTEILDPASDPSAPAYPNRLTIVVLATVAGILLGLAASRLHRPKLAAA